MTARIPGTVLWLFLLITPGVFAEEGAPADVLPGREAVESIPGMDASIQNAQQEITDPFAKRFAPPPPPVQAQEKAAPAIVSTLQGIGLGGAEAYAVIGDSVYYKGEEKNGIKLLEVRRGEVDIFVNGAMMTLPLFPGDDMKKAQERQEKKSGQKDPSGEPSTPKDPESFSKRGQGLS